MTPGEKRTARLLESHLEDDYLCWYESRVGNGARSRYTDFIVLHPSRGLLLLEVKDWKLSNLHSVDPQFFRLLTGNGLKSVQHPLEQARQCTYQLVNNLCRDRALLESDGPYAGKLVCPYAFGVILTAITRDEFVTSGLCEVLPENLVICRDEMVEGIDPEIFQTQLWNMFSTQFPKPLTLPQIDRVRWHLFPEIRITPPVQFDLVETTIKDTIIATNSNCTRSINIKGDNTSRTHPAEEPFPDIIKVMDLKQESLARSLGDGHRVIHGVAGSGKTLILGYRCLHLANLVAKPILVICFNVTLAARLRELTSLHDLGQRVHVRHFHDWCGEQLRTYHVNKPKPGYNYVTELVQTVIDATEAGHIPRAQYGAVMIDEGHDFEPDWLRLVVSMIDPETNSLLLLYDDAQAIYSKRTLDFSLSSVGVKARGRTTVLRVNYRNTDEILAFAYRFACEWLAPGDADDDQVPMLEPKNAGRRGPEPVVRLRVNFNEEAKFIAQCVMKQHSNGLSWGDMCITYRANWMGEIIACELTAAGVPVHWLKTTHDKTRLSVEEASVKLMTMHSSKGLEFPFVIVSGVGAMPGARGDITAEAKLLYVAMTRATETLLVTAHRRSEFVERLAA